MIFYSFPNTSLNSSNEFFCIIGADVLLEPSISFFYDFKEANGLYTSFDLGHKKSDLQFFNNTDCEICIKAGIG